MPLKKALKTKSITQKASIQASPEEVYKALTNAKIHSKFTGAKATGTARKGNTFTAWDEYISGKYLELEPGKRILAEWRTTEFPEDYPPSILELTLKPKGECTEIQLIQKGIPASQAQEYKKGWLEYYWYPLKVYFSKRND